MSDEQEIAVAAENIRAAEEKIEQSPTPEAKQYWKGVVAFYQKRLNTLNYYEQSKAKEGQ